MLAPVRRSFHAVIARPVETRSIAGSSCAVPSVHTAVPRGRVRGGATGGVQVLAIETPLAIACVEPPGETAAAPVARELDRGLVARLVAQRAPVRDEASGERPVREQVW